MEKALQNLLEALTDTYGIEVSAMVEIVVVEGVAAMRVTIAGDSVQQEWSKDDEEAFRRMAQ